MNKIKELRKEKNITVAELAKELGISQSMLTNYENGNGTPRDESIWEKLSQIFGVSKSHVMGLTTDIETANKTKQLKVVVDTSQPISIQPKNQTDLDVLIKLDMIDNEDMKEVSEFLDKLLAQEKYEEKMLLSRPLAQSTRRPVRNRRTGHPCGTLVCENTNKRI